MGREPLGVASAELTQSVQAGGVDPDPAAVLDCKQEVWGSTPRVSTQVRGPFGMTGGVSLVAVQPKYGTEVQRTPCLDWLPRRLSTSWVDADTWL